MMEVSPLQFENASRSITCTDAGKVILFRLEQNSKAFSFMITALGKDTLVNALQFLKALAPIVAVLGKVIEVSP